LGIITRTDQPVKQVTYNDAPLYFFVQDQAPGDTKGQGSKGFGGNWMVVKAG
jgi:predicted lipoprotein with Yx(FWY)xxD motif